MGKEISMFSLCTDVQGVFGKSQVALFNFLYQQERQKTEESVCELSFLFSVFCPVPIETVSPLVVSAESRQVL